MLSSFTWISAFVTLSVTTTLSIHIQGCCAKKHANEVNIEAYREKVKHMFYHAYEGYLKYAYPYDELKPLTCQGHDTWGSYSLTLIDALDTLAVLGNYSEFRRIANIVIDKGENAFDMDINVSVFETNIRIVGGLISGHLLMERAGMELEDAWPCSGPLLRMADSIARKLLPAFDTPTGMPYGTVNLRNGVPKGETSITCTACVGTFIVEFGTLSRLTGDPIFEKTAVRAIRSLWKYRSPIGLLGNHIDVKTGKWTALDSGIGGGVDSYFEYLVKGSILFNLPELSNLFRAYEEPIKKYLKKDDWYMWAQMNKGTITLPMFTSLDAFWPSIQMMLGDVDAAMKTLHNFHMVWRQFGFTPEYYNIPKSEAHKGREGYPLRPELIESIMYLYRTTKDPSLLKMGVDIVESIDREAYTSCGYATIKDVRDHRLDDRMESFFLSETVKYLYLLFDQDNFIHNNGSSGRVIETPSGSCVIDAGGYVFNTEAHPIDLAAVHCCSAKKLEEDKLVEEFHSNLDLLSLFNLVEDEEQFGMTGWRKKGKMNKNSKAPEIKVEGGGNDIKYETKEDDESVNLVNDDGKDISGRDNNKKLENNFKTNRPPSDLNIEVSLPSGPSTSFEEEKVNAKTLTKTKLTDKEKKIVQIFMDILHLDISDMDLVDIAEKLRSEFKDTDYHKIAEHLAEQLWQEGVKKEGTKKEDEIITESKAEKDAGHISTDESITSTDNKEKRDEALKDLLSQLTNATEEKANDLYQSTNVNVDNVVDINEKKPHSWIDKTEGDQNLTETESLPEKDDFEAIEADIKKDESDKALEKLKHHLKTEIQLGEEDRIQKNKDSLLSEKTSSLESRRENVLSLTKKVLDVFSALSLGMNTVDLGFDGDGETTPIQTDSPSIGNLYASLGHHTLRYLDDPKSMHCPVQPFYSRLSVYGEFFVDD